MSHNNDIENDLFFNEAAIASTIDKYVFLPEYDLYNQQEKDFSDFNIYFILSGDKYCFKDNTPEFCYLNNQMKYVVNNHHLHLNMDDHFMRKYYGLSKRVYGKDKRIVSFVLDKKYLKSDLYLNCYSKDENGDVIYQTSAFNTMIGLVAPEKSLIEEFDILYIGQSGGLSQNRNSILRLQSHSTLQKILSEYRINYPNKDIYILAIRLDIRQPLIFNAMSKEKPKYSIKHPVPSKKEIINIVEAMLIYHFQPSFNDKLKKTFPMILGKSYKQFFNLDYWNISFDYSLTNRKDTLNFLHFKSNNKIMKENEIISYSLKKGSTPKELGVFYYSSPHSKKK